MTTVYLHAFPVSTLLSAKLSGYLLSLLLASVFFFTGSKSLSESQIFLLLWAERQTTIQVAAFWRFIQMSFTFFTLWDTGLMSDADYYGYYGMFLRLWIGWCFLTWGPAGPSASNQPKTSPEPFVKPAPLSAGQHQSSPLRFPFILHCGNFTCWGHVNEVLTKPAWKDADGAITFCAETEVGIRWVELEKQQNQTKRRWIY